MWAGGFLLLGVGLIWLHGTGFPLALMWAVACLGLGGLLGFLFGIPRSATININQPGVAAVNARVGEVTTTDHPAQVPLAQVDQSKTRAEQPSTPAGLEIPKVPASPPNRVTATVNATDQPGTGNTSQSNLEQVSDWVTKLLLGGSLTQIANIPGIMANWGSYIASGLAEKPTAEHKAFATALIVYFLVLGFIGGYVITKVELGEKLRGA
jgi:hypothetical protein